MIEKRDREALAVFESVTMTRRRAILLTVEEGGGSAVIGVRELWRLGALLGSIRLVCFRGHRVHRVRVVLGPGVFGLELTAPRERGRESRVWARYGGARDHCLAL